MVIFDLLICFALLCFALSFFFGTCLWILFEYRLDEAMVLAYLPVPFGGVICDEADW